jgi:hypothetical protein
MTCSSSFWAAGARQKFAASLLWNIFCPLYNNGDGREIEAIRVVSRTTMSLTGENQFPFLSII